MLDTGPKSVVPQELETSGAILEREVTVAVRLGLHASVAALIVKLTNHLLDDVGTSIVLKKDDYVATPRGILTLLCLGAGPGSKLTVQITNPAKAAAEYLDCLSKLLRAHQPEVDIWDDRKALALGLPQELIKVLRDVVLPIPTE